MLVIGEMSMLNGDMDFWSVNMALEKGIQKIYALLIW